ncbi:MAG: sugar ABC transporter substrate-binding protein [Bacteroidetes bacterium]|nr:MAG: sugar ABC transporter substrate-binding protein [Bacteroidota bacterium]
MKAKLIVFFIIYLFTFNSIFLFSSGKQEVEKLPDQRYRFYVVTHGGISDPFWGVVKKGAKEAGDMFDCDVIYLGPETFSIQKLVDMVETAIAGKPDGLVVTITDIQALDKPLRAAIDAGIPVVAINVPDPRDLAKRIPYLAYVGADDYSMGTEAAKRMLEEFKFNKPQRGVILVHEVGNAGLEARANGITKIFMDMNIPVDKLAGFSNASENYQVMDAYLIKHPETDMVFTFGPLGADPVLKLIDDKNLTGKIKLGGIDLSISMIRAIREGNMVFTVEQQQFLQGYLPIGLLVLYNKYGVIPHDDILTGPEIVDIKNVDKVADMVNKRFR